jgi:uncharacterized protein (TIGR03435 family)
MMARMLPISVLVQMLGSHLGASPVVDKTGLTAKYDFTLDFNQDAVVAAPVGSSNIEGPDFVSAFKEQLGLILVPKHVPIDVLVIDSADERPIEN